MSASMKVNGKDDIPYIMEHKKCLKPPTGEILCLTNTPKKFGAQVAAHPFQSRCKSSLAQAQWADRGGFRHQTTSQPGDPGDSQLQKQNPVNDGETSAYKIYNVGKPIINHPSGDGLYHL